MARVLRMPDVSDPGSARLVAWLVDESGDFAGDQSIATVETDTSFVNIEVNQPGVLVRSLVTPGQHVAAGSALALLAEPGEVIEDVEQLMLRLGLAVAPQAQAAGAHLRAIAATDPLTTTAWPADEAPRGGHAASDSVAPDSARPVEDAAAVTSLAGWVDVLADALVTGVRPEHPAAAAAPAGVSQARLRMVVRAEPLLSVVEAVDGVSLIGLIVKAVAVTCRRVPLRPETSTIAEVALQRRTPSGTVAPVVHVANLMTASSVTSTIADLDGRLAHGRGVTDGSETAAVLVIDLADDGVAEGALDATEAHPAVLVLGDVHRRAVVEGDVLVPAQVLAATLTCDAGQVDLATAARWFAELSRLLEQPLQFLT
ncbi:2-oxo acid dehydrogenase subunit E2 [Nocardioides cynanchi]|uniref:2-oxo acid dehydrogenase subunit E2 n=1 Tax=Nocardioides cynanchi TaxID=2558918 RepID=UPI001785B870|nr:2-oxo acid dehydrogenase subunit E2 [Nocardioides cynanchi]